MNTTQIQPNIKNLTKKTREINHHLLVIGSFHITKQTLTHRLICAGTVVAQNEL